MSYHSNLLLTMTTNAQTILKSTTIVQPFLERTFPGTHVVWLPYIMSLTFNLIEEFVVTYICAYGLSLVTSLRFDVILRRGFFFSSRFWMLFFYSCFLFRSFNVTEVYCVGFEYQPDM